MGNEDFAEMVDALMQDDSDAAAEFRARYQTGCGADDTADSRGRPLRPRVNDAGEPW